MDKTIIINELRRKNEILPNEFDGTYRSVRKALEYYAKLKKTSLIDHNDLALLYYLSLGIWKNEKNERKQYIQKTHLLHNDKLLLETHLAKIWSGEARSLFCHAAGEQEEAFLTAPVSLRDSAKKSEPVQFFFKLCINILDVENDSVLFETVQKMLSSQIKTSGIPVYIISRILH